MRASARGLLAWTLLVLLTPAARGLDAEGLKQRRLEVYAKDAGIYRHQAILDFVFTLKNFTDAQADAFLAASSDVSPAVRAAQWADIARLLGAVDTKEDPGGERLREYILRTKLPAEELYFLAQLDSRRRALIARWGPGHGAKNWRQNCMNTIGAPAERTRCDDRRDDLNSEMDVVLRAQKLRKWNWRWLTANDDPKAWTNFNIHNVSCYIYEHEGVSFRVVPDSWENLMLPVRDWFWYWDKSSDHRVFHLLDAAGEAAFCDMRLVEEVNKAQHEAAAAKKFLQDNKVGDEAVKRALERADLPR